VLLSLPENFQVNVILRPAVSRQVRLGVGHPLGQMIKIEISLSDNYYLSFSSMAPSLRRERVSNLQCNHALVKVSQDP
jgi:hypothetical protein